MPHISALTQAKWSKQILSMESISKMKWHMHITLLNFFWYRL